MMGISAHIRGVRVRESADYEAVMQSSTGKKFGMRGGDKAKSSEQSEADGGDAAMPHIKLDHTAQVLIGQHLKAIYGEIVQQPVPDRFLELLDELERKERGQ